MDDSNEQKILYRLERIYDSLEALTNYDLNAHRRPSGSAVQPRIRDYPNGFRMPRYDNVLLTVGRNIATCRSMLIKWAKDRGSGASEITEAFKTSFPLRVILDLRDNDEHPYPRRDGGHSGCDPDLINSKPVMKITAQPGEGATTVQFGPNGWQCNKPTGAAIVTTAQVVDSKGKVIGDYADLASRAVRDLAHLIDKLGIK